MTTARDGRCSCGGGPCASGPCASGPDRRAFLGAAAAVSLGLRGSLGGQDRDEPDHFVPADKKFSRAWIESLTRRERVAPWRGEHLRAIAMPCGGIAAGQLCVTGDGKLAQWWIANDVCHTSWGGQTAVETPAGEQGVGYGAYEPARIVNQCSLIAWRDEAGGSGGAVLERESFPETSFLGEYPVATIDCGPSEHPVRVQAEVFSPFVPLSARDSAIPCTILRYTLRNVSERAVHASLAVAMENPVMRTQRRSVDSLLRNACVEMEGLRGVAMDAVDRDPDPRGEIDVFADFERGYGDWTVESGTAMGEAPARGTLPNQNPVTGYEGERLVNTYAGGDDSLGSLLSPEFRIRRPFILFRIGGGRDPRNLALELELLDEGAPRVVRSATGGDDERLFPSHWDVLEFVGRRARLRIRDSRKGPWGHVNVDDIRFADQPPPRSRFAGTHPQAGDVALVFLGEKATATADARSARALLDALRRGEEISAPRRAKAAAPPLAAVARTVKLQPGEEKVLSFAVTWFFPNRLQRDDEGVSPGQQCGASGPRVGNMYANWFHSALSVAQYLAEKKDELARTTFLFRDALYRDTTLPGWFVQRVAAPLSTLATGTLQWRADGRVWAWEGVGCCAGTCGHVWNYAQGMAWIFPELERSVREGQDLAPGRGFHDDGSIGFRGTPRSAWAADAQGGYVLKVLREHLLSRDGGFLARNWPATRKALEFLIGQDGEDPDGLIEGSQHNTYDIEFYGPNTMVGSLYLGALRAGAFLARLRGDEEFAARCERVAERGSELSMRLLWNGDYFAQAVPESEKERQFQYGDGCLSDQMLGEWFAGTLGLGPLYPRGAVRKTLRSIFAFNWAPDVGPQNRAHPPERVFASPGEAGLFVCTWPKSRHPGERGVRYRDEVWTGSEHQVAGHMLREGMVLEGLSILRGLHERYDGKKHDPYNEVECGDHYARALASWSCLLGISGFTCDVPAGELRFAPRLSPGDFRCFFSAGTGWGSIGQSREGARQTDEVHVLHGSLALGSLVLEVEQGMRVAAVDALLRDGDREVPLDPAFAQEGNKVAVRFADRVDLRAGESGRGAARRGALLSVVLRFA